MRKHPLYGVWADIKKRCYNTNCRAYKWYGERGVVMCDEWLNNFKSFYDWCILNGWEKGMQIDKDIIPKSLGISAIIYSPEMCTIATRKQNMNSIKTNVYFEYMGDVKSLSEWADLFNIKYKCLWGRIQDGWSLDRALNTPIRKQNWKVIGEDKKKEVVIMHQKGIINSIIAKTLKIDNASVTNILRKNNHGYNNINTAL